MYTSNTEINSATNLLVLYTVRRLLLSILLTKSLCTQDKAKCKNTSLAFGVSHNIN